MPPEYLFKKQISPKFDIFSLGVIMTKIIAGPEGRVRSAEMPYQEFLDQVRTLSLHLITKRAMIQIVCYGLHMEKITF